MRTIEEIKAEMERAIEKYDTDKMNELYKEEALYYVRDIQVGRLTEICNAERDGRLVVLPCKKGDTVWAKTSFFSKNVTEIKALAVRFNGFEYKVTCEGIGDLTFGKTVFLTKAEAEQALKGGAE